MYIRQLCALLFFLLLHLSVFTQGNLDLRILRSVNPENPDNGLVKAVSITAKPLSVLLPVGLMTHAILQHDAEKKQQAWKVLGSVVIAAASTEILKRSFQRQRPYWQHTGIHPYETDHSYAFPSGHVSVVFANIGALTLQYKKAAVLIPLYTWGAAVAYSRIYLGQHYPSDVLAGAVVGMGSAYLSRYLYKKIIEQKKTKRSSATLTRLMNQDMCLFDDAHHKYTLYITNIVGLT